MDGIGNRVLSARNVLYCAPKFSYGQEVALLVAGPRIVRLCEGVNNGLEVHMESEGDT